MKNEIQFLFYNAPDANGNIQVYVKDDTLWATQTLNEYIRKGFVMDDERLKQGKTAFGKDYFRELPERMRLSQSMISLTVCNS